jgi:hypothetical protein
MRRSKYKQLIPEGQALHRRQKARRFTSGICTSSIHRLVYRLSRSSYPDQQFHRVGLVKGGSNKLKDKLKGLVPIGGFPRSFESFALNSRVSAH